MAGVTDTADWSSRSSGAGSIAAGLGLPALPLRSASHPALQERAPLRLGWETIVPADSPRHPALQERAPLRHVGVALECPDRCRHPALQERAPLRRIGEWGVTRGKTTVIPLFRSGLHCGIADSILQGRYETSHPALQERAPLRQGQRRV